MSVEPSARGPGGERRSSPSLPAVGAAFGLAVGIALVLLVPPERGPDNRALPVGVSAGYVARYVVLGLVGGWLVHRLRAAGARRVHALAVAGLIIVAALAILPPLLSRPPARPGISPGFRASYIDACARQRPRPTCACIFDMVARRPAYDTDREFAAAVRSIQENRSVPGAFVGAVAACAAASG